MLFSILCCGLYFYAGADEYINSEKIEIINQFESGQNLKCKNNEVNLSAYNYSYGTATFIPKDKKSGLPIVEIKKCLVKK